MLSADSVMEQISMDLRTSAITDKHLLEFYINYEIYAPIFGYCIGFVAFILLSILEKLIK